MKLNYLVDQDIKDKISELGRLWRNSNYKPKIEKNILESWDQLISEWVEDKSLPLIIRKSNDRGREFNHPFGRKIIISDNTFAIWVYHNVLNKKTFTISEIKQMLNNNDIPIVYALKKAEKQNAKYTKTLGNYQLARLKVCHIEPVGLNSRKSIEDIDIKIIIEHFKKFANPKNMFLLPKEIGGLGEIQEFINEQRY